MQQIRFSRDYTVVRFLCVCDAFLIGSGILLSSDRAIQNEFWAIEKLGSIRRALRGFVIVLFNDNRGVSLM